MSLGIDSQRLWVFLVLFGLLNLMMTKTLLILAANPKDSDRVQFDQEIRDIKIAWERSRDRLQFKLETELALTWGRFRQALVDHKPEIIHFVGHGHGKAGLVIEAEDGTIQEISGDRLLKLLQSFSVKCVVLNACHSKAQAETIHEHVPCVIGMKQKIAQESSREFAIAFYDGVFGGMGYREACKLGNTEILSKFDEFKPYLLIRSNQQGLQVEAIEDKLQDKLLKITEQKLSLVEGRDSEKSILSRRSIGQWNTQWKNEIHEIDYDAAIDLTNERLEKVKNQALQSVLFLFQNSDRLLGKHYSRHLSNRIQNARIGKFSQPYQVGLSKSELQVASFLKNLAQLLNVPLTHGFDPSKDEVIDRIADSFIGCSVFFIEINLPNIEQNCVFTRWLIEEFWQCLIGRVHDLSEYKHCIMLITLDEQLDQSLIAGWEHQVQGFVALPPSQKWELNDIQKWMQQYSGLPASSDRDAISRTAYRASDGIPAGTEGKLLEELSKYVKTKLK